MAKAAERYVCQSCGAVHRKWVGRCDSCDGWNTVIEEIPLAATPAARRAGRGKVIELKPLQGARAMAPRLATGIAEFDRAVGGGLVEGSALLVGGDPGIGKSTVLLQVTARLARAGIEAVYISGEESEAQLCLRAERLGLADAPLRLATATGLSDILATVSAAPETRVLVIDSIQTIYTNSLDSAPGTVAQVRASAHELIRFAKTRGIALLLVGHVTKDGQIAGPRVLEHMVDAVLYFEGDRGHQYRILRAVKNRFGGTDEIGVFEMTDGGLIEVGNPSTLFLTEREGEVAGTAVFAGIEGTRPLLIEVQALIAPSPLATPRRAVIGWDGGRLAMIIAVLEARCGLRLSGNDVYLNVAGGIRINEPAADLAVAAALLSALTATPPPSGSVFFGEISLAAEVRPVSRAEARLREAAKLGFARAFLPEGSTIRKAGLKTTTLSRLSDLLGLFPGPARPPRGTPGEED